MPTTPVSGAPKTALHFIEKQKHAALVADLTQAEQKLSRCGMNATFALNGFDKNCDCIGVDCRLHRIEIAKWQMLEARQKWAEIFFDLFLPRGGDASHGAPMEGSGECQNAGPARGAAKSSSEFNQALVGFGSTVAKEDLSLSGDFHKTPCESCLGACAVEIGCVDELSGLLTNGTCDLWMSVPERAHGDSSAKV
jgi:hypothetical protein